MAIYGISGYGIGIYGPSSLRTSETWDLMDFCEPTDQVMTTLFDYPEVVAARTVAPPQYSFNGAYDLCLYSDDAQDSGLSVEVSVPASFSMQFTILPTALPEDFTSLTTERFFCAAYNQYGKMAGLLLSEIGGLALSQDGVGTGFQHLIDSADLFTEGAQYYTFRVTVNNDTGVTNIYVTPTALLTTIGHQLRITTQALDAPQGVPDGLVFEVYGSASDPTHVCFDCIRLASKEVIPNARPIADPGVDQTSTLYKYAAFDGRNSYDPEGQQLRYWWTITGAPESSTMWTSGNGDTPTAPGSDYTNIVNGPSGAAVGTFSDVKVGDLLFIEDAKSTIKYIAEDGSYAVAVDAVFPESVSNVYWNVLSQAAWEGSWQESEVIVVEDYTDTEPTTPAIDSVWLVGDTPSGPNWVAGDAGKLAVWDGLTWAFTILEVGDIVYSVADYENYRLLDTGPFLWRADDPEPWELPHWSGRADAIGTMLPDYFGLFTAELIVNDGTHMILPPLAGSFDGSLNSVPAEVLLNVSPTGAPLGLVPDLSFIWNYLSNFWSLVENRGMIQTVWSGAAQILAGDMLELWQHDYAKSLFDIQRLFQRRWRGYDFFYEEPNYDDDVYAAALDTTVDESGYSAAPGLTDYGYELGVTPPTGVASGHMLILNGQAYEIALTQDTSVITRDLLPPTENARIYFDTVTSPFAINDLVTGSVTSETATVIDVEWDNVIVDSPSGAFQIGETLTGAPSGGSATVTGYVPAATQRPRYWQIRPTVTSKSTDFTLEAVQQADTALFDIYDVDENDHIRVGCYIYAARGNKLCFDPTNLSTYLADTDRYTTRFYGIVHRNYIPVDEKVMDISSLQEVIDIENVEGAPPILVGNNDFIVETTTAVDGREVQAINLLESYLERKAYGFDGDTSAPPTTDLFDAPGASFLTSLGEAGTDLSNYLLWVEGERYRLSEVISDTRVKLADEALTPGEVGLHWRIHESGDPPDRSWAETTYVDNKDAIEANYGVRVGFTQDDWAQRTEDLDYLAAVQGLWYSFWNSPAIDNIRTACQVLMGLPFAEKAGTVTDIRTPFNTKYNRVLVQDEGDEVIVRSYLFPVGLDVDTNPETDQPYTVGDTIEQFAPICTGVLVQDYLSDPDWLANVIGSGDLHEVQKFHTFGVTVNSNAFNYTNLQYMVSYLVRLTEDSVPKIRQHFTHPMFIVQLNLEDNIDIEDAMLMGPAWPPEIPGSPGSYFKYPFNASWTADLETIVPGWSDSPFYPDSNRWETLSSYDHTLRWPSGGRAANVPPRPQEFGNLHLDDVPGNVPDPWDGAWPQAPLSGGSHTSTAREGTFLYGDTDESGHFIHVYGTSETDLAQDGDMEDAAPPSGSGPYWYTVNYGGSSHTLTAVKSSTQSVSPTKSCRITSIGPLQGIEQSFTIEVGHQFASKLWIYMVSGQAHIQLYDGSTLAAEWRFSGPASSWNEITLHNWKATTTTGTIRILTGPAGGDFYVDDVSLYADAVPWVQWGYGRMYIGRTGGYTVGGLPDEDLEQTIHAVWP